ncbi:MAG: alpha-ketoacid dehydrogenase subunit beta [Bacillota bacterium]|jgi:pyruvate dehydrogenase E1 component beta subunit|nr:alpha-ketoacid dehydrogenase subunit beta [Bacillota bacterium]
MRELTYTQALGEALAEEMRRDERVFVMGLDVGPYGGAFGVTQGLYDMFPGRVLDMPISEAGYVGAAVGAALTGCRPVVELQYSDWITIASDQLVNQAANMRYMFGGTCSVPMVLRAPVGGYLSAAAQHSHMFESWFGFVPGLKVVLPATPYDAKGLLKAAIRDDNPVIFFEHKQLYKVKGPVPEEDYIVPLGKADIKRAGKDVTIVTYSYMVDFSLRAAEQLAIDGIDVEVVDLRTISPLDEETILESVRKTNRLVAVQETWRPFGVVAEVSAIVAEKAVDYLDAPIKRVASKFAPVPFSPNLERYVLPSVDDIVAAVKETVGS